MSLFDEAAKAIAEGATGYLPATARRVRLADCELVIYDAALDVLPAQHAAEVTGGAGGEMAAGGAGKGALPKFDELVILLGPGFRPKSYGIMWVQPVGAARGVQGEKMPFKLLLAAEPDADGHDRHRILAAVYHLDGQPVGAVASGPRPGDDQQLDAVAVQGAPQVDHAEHSTEERDPKGNHFSHGGAEKNAPATGGQA